MFAPSECPTSTIDDTPRWVRRSSTTAAYAIIVCGPASGGDTPYPGRSGTTMSPSPSAATTSVSPSWSAPSPCSRTIGARTEPLDEPVRQYATDREVVKRCHGGGPAIVSPGRTDVRAVSASNRAASGIRLIGSTLRRHLRRHDRFTAPERSTPSPARHTRMPVGSSIDGSELDRVIRRRTRAGDGDGADQRHDCDGRDAGDHSVAIAETTAEGVRLAKPVGNRRAERAGQHVGDPERDDRVQTEPPTDRGHRDEHGEKDCRREKAKAHRRRGQIAGRGA